MWDLFVVDFHYLLYNCVQCFGAEPSLGRLRLWAFQTREKKFGSGFRLWLQIVKTLKKIRNLYRLLYYGLLNIKV